MEDPLFWEISDTGIRVERYIHRLDYMEKKPWDMSKSVSLLDYMSRSASLLDDMLISASLLDNQSKHYEGTKYVSKLKDADRGLKTGLEFLDKLYFLWTDRMADIVKDDIAELKHKLTTYEEDNVVLNIIRLRKLYESLRENVKLMVNNATFCIFQDGMYSRGHVNILLENILEVLSNWYNNNNATANDQTTALVKVVGELRMSLIYYKPLCRCLAHPWHLEPLVNYAPLEFVLNKAAVATYLLLVNEMDGNSLVYFLQRILHFDKQGRSDDIYVRFLKFSSSEISSDVKGQFYILDNLIHILAMNSDSLNDTNNHLYVELMELQTIVSNQRGTERLNNYLGLTASTEAVCYQAVPIVYSNYMEEAELVEGMRSKLVDTLIGVIDQIKIIKHDYDSPQIKVHDYPRVDGLGFLEFFSGYLKELHGHEQMSIIRNEIESLHMDIHCIVCSFKKSQEKLTSEGLYTDILQLAYQAEYVIDFYLVFSDLRCISTFPNIVEEVKEIKEKLLALPDKSLPVEYIALTTSNHLHNMPLDVNEVFIGFQEEIDSIMNFLLGGENDLQTISVVGMAGAGKTSLARRLFKESSVVGHFDRKAWCTVSQSYQWKDLLLTILNQISPLKSDIRNIDDEELAVKLFKSLKKYRYLVVIDDVWDVSFWKYLSRYFPNDKTQSRILITSRDHNVALETKSMIHELRALTEEESWGLLQLKLLQRESLNKNLEQIAKEVSKSCKGLPLSIVIIGGLLQTAARNDETWNQIAKDVTSTILRDPQGKCEDILELSYNHLPNHLKSCLLYLGVFPEDHEISVTRLVRLWVAEGLVQGIASDECVEDVGRRYVVDLITRSLAIPIKEKTEGAVKIVQVHDLLRDFCLKKGKEGLYFTVLDRRGIFDLPHFPRRICINGGMDKHLPFISLNGVRTIISFCRSNIGDGEVEQIMKSKHMVLLNVLDMQELVDPASYLHPFFNLRYLAIWKIDRGDEVLVQSSISKMWKLQILILSCSYNHVFKVPDFIWDLVKLKHLHLLPSALFPCHNSKRIEDSAVLLENLKSLSKPRLHYGDSNWLNKLPKLQKLSCIFFYSRDDFRLNRYEFLELNLCNRLTSLKVENGARRYERERVKLHFPASLRKLSLLKFMLSSDDISEIGKSLPNLEVLKLHDSIESWSVNDEDFQTLKVLKISGGYCREWDASEDSFPSLERLFLDRCYTLEGIPLRFGDIPSLHLISIKYCNSSVYDSAREIQMIQAEAQNLELKVKLKCPILNFSSGKRQTS